MTHPPAPVRVVAALGLAILAVSTASIFIRLAQREAPSLVVAAFRLTAASLVLAPIGIARHRTELRSMTRTDLGLALLSGLFLAAHFATWISSLEYTTVASSVVLVSTGPLWIALLSPVLLRERLGRFAVFGLGLALLGGAAVGLSDACFPGAACTAAASEGTNPPLGNFLALAGAWAVTGYLIIGRRLRGRMSLIPYILLVYGTAAVALIIVMAAAGESPFGYSPVTYLWMLLLALVPQLIGHSTYNWALRYMRAALVAVTTLGEPIGSTVLAFIILKEYPTPIKLAGAGLILAGIYVASLGKQPAGAESATHVEGTAQ